jgi:hypothetical protein
MLKQMIARCLLVLGLCLIAGVALTASAQAALPGADELQPGWNRLEPAGATCANGEPYAFFVRPGNPDKLTVYFQGGGACWDRATCGPFGPYDRNVTDAAREIGASGLFDFEDSRNPIADHTVVFVSYCTGDVHTGSRTVTVEGDDPLTIAFRGYDNATAVLDWTQANYPDVASVFVTGTSAGAYGALFNAPRIFEAYPNATQRVFGDAGIGVTPGNWQGFDVWGLAGNLPGGENTRTSATGLASALAAYSATTFPNARVAQYTTVADNVQKLFYGLMGGNAEDWAAGMREQLTALDGFDNARVFVAPGDSHGILPAPAYYTIQADGVALADWLPAWLSGDLPDSVSCADCS